MYWHVSMYWNTTYWYVSIYLKTLHIDMFLCILICFYVLICFNILKHCILICFYAYWYVFMHIDMFLRIDMFWYIETYQYIGFQSIETYQCVVIQFIEIYQYIERYLFLQWTLTVHAIFKKDVELTTWQKVTIRLNLIP